MSDTNDKDLTDEEIREKYLTPSELALLKRLNGNK